MNETRRTFLRLAGLAVLGCPGLVQAANIQAAKAMFGDLPRWLQNLIKEKGDMSKTIWYEGPFPKRGTDNYTVPVRGQNIFAYPKTYAKENHSRKISFNFKAPPTFGFKLEKDDMTILLPDERKTVELIIQKTNDVLWAARYFPDGRPTDKEVQNGEAIGMLSTEVLRMYDQFQSTDRHIEKFFQTKGITDDKEKAVCRVVGIPTSTAEIGEEIPMGQNPVICHKIVTKGGLTSIYHGTKQYNPNVLEAQELAWIYTQGFRNNAVQGTLNSLKRIQANRCPELGYFSDNAIEIFKQLETFGETIEKQVSKLQPRDLVWKEPGQNRNQLPSLRNKTERQ